VKTREKKSRLFEDKSISLTKKIFLKTIVEALSGGSPAAKIQGSLEEVRSVSEALASTREFHNVLNDPKATLSSVTAALEKKQESASEFERIHGISWPL